MTFNNWGELKRGLQQEMKNALQDTMTKSHEIITEETNDFYSGGFPKYYVRTGKFGRTAAMDGIQGGGDMISCEVYMDGNYTYETGSHPSGYTVFMWAENSEAGIVGLPDTWLRSELRIDDCVDETFREHFE